MSNQISPNENILHKCQGGKMYVVDCDDCGDPIDPENYFYCYSTDGEKSGVGWISVKDYNPLFSSEGGLHK